jgi:hypothetical protein
MDSLVRGTVMQLDAWTDTSFTVVLENLDPTLANEYTASLVTPCVQAASYVDNILKKISPEDERGDLLQTTLTVLAITNTILDFVSFCYDEALKSSVGGSSR